MKVVLQRVNSASVAVDGEIIASIERGLLLLVGFGKDDSAEVLEPMLQKIINLRIFPDEKGRFHYSVLDMKGGILAVPQFTLFADTSKGRRPEFFEALEPGAASALFDQFIEKLTAAGVSPVQAGKFGAYMQVQLENDGPVTILL